MRSLKKFVPFAISLIITPFALVLGFGSAVEGDLFYTKLLFPYATIFLTLARLLNGHPDEVAFTIFLGLGVIQFPTYGMILSLVKDRPPVNIKLAAIHICGSALAFILLNRLGL